MNNPYKLNLSKYSTHNIIRTNIGENNNILDVGCNNGYIGNVSDKSNKFYGLDYMAESIKEAKKMYTDAVEYDLNNFHDLPWGIKFHVIIFADILEHLLYPDKVLYFFISKYLDDNGKIIVSLPNVPNWQIRLNLLFGRFNYTEAGILDKTHLHLYTFQSAKELILSSNLKIIKKYGGASVSGIFIKIFPFLKPFLATNIILILKKQ